MTADPTACPTPLRPRRGLRRAALLASLAAALGAGLALGPWAAPSAEAQEGEICNPSLRKPPGPTEELGKRFWWDPCPASDAREAELALPLPAQGSLVFREVKTPGESLFAHCAGGDSVVSLGDRTDTFVSYRTRGVRGGFPAGDAWVYFLAKYELSVGQASAIMAGDPRTGDASTLSDGMIALADLLTAEDDAPDAAVQLAKNLRKFASGGLTAPAIAQLARPITALAPADMDDLARRYSLWCLRTGPCRDAMRPRAEFEGVPGFIRLPSEVEWEFAARGGGDNVRETIFKESRPFPREGMATFANVASEGRGEPRLKLVGTGRQPTLGGFYDLFGNASELSLDFFSAEYGEGKVGGRVARGGHVQTPGDLISSGLRAEVPVFDVRDDSVRETRDTFVGARFAIGAVVKPTSAYDREAGEEKRTEACPTPEGVDPIAESITTISAPSATEADTSGLSDEAKARLRELSLQLGARTRDLCRFLAQGAFQAGRSHTLNTARAIREADLAETQRENYRTASTIDLRNTFQRLQRRHESQRDNLQRAAQASLRSYDSTLEAIAAHGESCAVDGFKSFRASRDSQLILRQSLTPKEGGSTGMTVLEIVEQHADKRVTAARPPSARERSKDFLRLATRIRDELK